MIKARKFITIFVVTALVFHQLAFFAREALASGIKTQFQTIAAGDGHSLAVKEDGSLWGWGNNLFGQLGGMGIQLTPVFILDGVRAAAAHDTSSFAIRSEGGLWYWGRYGTLPGFMQVSVIDIAIRTAVEPEQVFLVQHDGTVLGGSDVSGLMNGTAAAAAGVSHFLMVKSDGSLWSMEYNQGYQSHVMDNVAAITSYGSAFLALQTDGSLWSWGYCGKGRLGGGTDVYRDFPGKIMDNVASVSTGGEHALAVTYDGSLWAWGNNNNSQLGDGTGIDRNTPVRVMRSVTGAVMDENELILTPLTGVVAAAGGLSHSLALTADGSLWTWGQNNYGQLGDGSNTDRSYAVKVMEGVSTTPAPVAAFNSVQPFTPDYRIIDYHVTVMHNGRVMNFTRQPVERNGFLFYLLDDVIANFCETAEVNKKIGLLGAFRGKTGLVVNLTNLAFYGQNGIIEFPPGLEPFRIGDMIYVYMDSVLEGLGLAAGWDGAANIATVR